MHSTPKTHKVAGLYVGAAPSMSGALTDGPICTHQL